MATKARPKVIVKGRAAGPNGHKKAQLHFVASRSAGYNDIFQDGLIVPDQMDADEALVPLDFTVVSSKVVGQQFSYWSVRFAHLVFLVGVTDAEIGNKKHDLKQAEAKWRRRNQKNFSAKYKADDAMWKNKEISVLRESIARLEAISARNTALLESYKALREAASREITRRTQEKAPRD